MQTEKILMATTILAATALARYRFANFAGATANATDAALGVPTTSFDAGEQASVATHGEMLVEAGGAVAVGGAGAKRCHRPRHYPGCRCRCWPGP